MGAFTTWPSWPASGSATGGAAGAPGAGRASAGAGAVPRPSVAADAGAMLTAPPLTIFTFSSPSVISSSAMPDSCTRSISFFSLRRSIASSPRGGDSAPRTRGGLQWGILQILWVFRGRRLHFSATSPRGPSPIPLGRARRAGDEQLPPADRARQYRAVVHRRLGALSRAEL